MLVKKSYKKNEEISEDDFRSKSAERNVQKTFERLQEMLKRVTAMNYVRTFFHSTNNYDFER